MSELKESKAHIDKMKAQLMDKENKLHSILKEYKGLSLNIKSDSSIHHKHKLLTELKESEAFLAEMKARLLDKGTKIKSVIEVNETLKMEIKTSKANEEVVSLVRVTE